MGEEVYIVGSINKFTKRQRCTSSSYAKGCEGPCPKCCNKDGTKKKSKSWFGSDNCDRCHNKGKTNRGWIDEGITYKQLNAEHHAKMKHAICETRKRQQNLNPKCRHCNEYVANSKFDLLLHYAVCTKISDGKRASLFVTGNAEW